MTQKCESCNNTLDIHSVKVEFVLTDSEHPRNGEIIDTQILCMRCYYQAWD